MHAAINTLTHGWNGLLLGYLTVGFGLLLAARSTKPNEVGVMWPWLTAFPVLIAVGILSDAFFSFFGSFGPQDGILSLLVGFVFFVVASGLIGVVLLRRQVSFRHIRGAILRHGSNSRRQLPADSLTIAGQRIARDEETKHFKILGTTGTGKTTAITELLTGAISRGDRVVIADPDGGYLNRFYNPERGDKILNPFDRRAASWGLFGEIAQIHDADQIALSLIPDYSGSDRNWRGYARTFLTALLRQLHRNGEQDLGEFYRLLITAPVDELRDFLHATPASPFLVQENGKFAASVRAVANNHLASVEHIALQQGGEQLSIRKWIRGGAGALFLPYSSNEIASLRYLISTWMRLAIFETMNSEENRDQRLWFVVDELDALGPIDGLKDALARLRKYGGRCVLGLQSIAQVRGNYGDAESQTIVENCGNTLILRCSASEHGGTSAFASGLIGKREILRRETSRSLPFNWFSSGGSRNESERHVIEDVVMASEIEQLPDLTGFLKLAADPGWMRVVLSRQ